MGLEKIVFNINMISVFAGVVLFFTRIQASGNCKSDLKFCGQYDRSGKYDRNGDADRRDESEEYI